MSRISVKQCTVTIGGTPKFYAEVGDTVSIRAPDGHSLLVVTIESIESERVTVKHHDDEKQVLGAAELVGVIRT